MRLHCNLSRVAVLLTLATLLLAGGCGTKDPFVGTWRVNTTVVDDFVIIAKTSSGYRLTVLWGAQARAQLPLTRRQDKLVGTLRTSTIKGFFGSSVSVPTRSRLVFTLDRASGAVSLHETPVGSPYALLYEPGALVRVNDRTSMFTPSPP
jgi:hypothetical protein